MLLRLMLVFVGNDYHHMQVGFLSLSSVCVTLYSDAA